MNNNVNVPEKYQQSIKSFVIRAGRLTAGQQGAYDRQWPAMGFSLKDGMFDSQKQFKRNNPKVLEIGFGMGQSFVAMAKASPEKDFIGIEVHLPGVGSALRLCEEHQVSNVSISKDDAVEVLTHCIADESLDTVQLFFPDPWHKKRHNKRRIVKDKFVQAIRLKLKTGGCFHMATDWQPYAEHMMDVMSQATGYENIAGQGQYVPRPEFRPKTKFEKRGERLDHGVWDLIFKKVD
jgi:tRNA (guanine-N7-)-methyltransferase